MIFSCNFAIMVLVNPSYTYGNSYFQYSEPVTLRSNSSMSLNTFPNEILLEIINILRDQGVRWSPSTRYYSLSLAKCSKRLHALSIQTLYGTCYAKSPDTMIFFTRTMTENRSLASKVHSLDLSHFNPWGSQRQFIVV